MRFLMCPPSIFDVEYVINPWMEGKLHATEGQIAQDQWTALHTLVSQNARAEILTPVAGLPDLVFTANAGLVYRETVILSNFLCPERQGESPVNERWFRSQGFKLAFIPDSIPFEGAGDALFDRGKPLLWFGHGFRSDLRALPHLAKITGGLVQPLQLSDRRFYHLDTCFCPLDGGHLLYFPGGFDAAGNAAIEHHVPPEKRLAVPEADAVRFTCNAINIGNTVILNDASDRTVQWLEERGFNVVKTRLQEFMKSGGAAKCLSLRLDEVWSGSALLA